MSFHHSLSVRPVIKLFLQEIWVDSPLSPQFGSKQLINFSELTIPENVLIGKSILRTVAHVAAMCVTQEYLQWDLL